MQSLMNQKVVIVGASSGIGLAMSQLAAERGAKVFMLSRSIDKLTAAAQSVQNAPTLVAVDMLDENAIALALEKIGSINHLVLTAVADENKRRNPITHITAEQMERSMDKLRGFFYSVKAAAPYLSESSSITLTSGASALKPPKQGMAILASVNASVISLGHALALEMSPVRVNTVTPGVVDTPVWSADDRLRIKAWAESEDLPARRFGQAQDIAEAIMFLISNPYMTGHNLVIDGGLTAK
jgi:NAD(P)-dependent dehydrogenase (short-subunit alcohol dehydrogenase family)